MRRGQTEIIGFMVIILLLFFALIFYFKFSTSDTTDVLGETEQSLEVSNLLTVMKQYTLCSDTSLGDAIKTCAQGGGFVCDADACTTVQSEVAQIASLNGWDNSSYMFYIGDVLYSPSTCTGNTFAEMYTTSNVEVKLLYCY